MMSGEEVRPAVLTAQQAAVYLGISVVTLYRLLRGGCLPHTRVGGSIRFRLTDLEGYLEDNTSRVWCGRRKGGEGDVSKKEKPRR